MPQLMPFFWVLFLFMIFLVLFLIYNLYLNSVLLNIDTSKLYNLDLLLNWKW